jgi:hypothetical protein
MESINNSYPFEGEVNGQITINIPLKARYIEIINDNATGTLKYKFGEGENFATLKPLEAITPRVKSRIIILSGTGEYRVRAEA